MTLHVTMNKYQVFKRCCYLNVKNVTEVMEELGNPFADRSASLYSLETKQIMSERVVEAVRSAEDMGKMYQYQKCCVNTSVALQLYSMTHYIRTTKLCFYGEIKYHL